MKVKEVIERLSKFDPDVEVAACFDDEDFTVFYIDVDDHITKCIRHENGAIRILSPNDPNGLQVVFLHLSENGTSKFTKTWVRPTIWP